MTPHRLSHRSDTETSDDDTASDSDHGEHRPQKQPTQGGLSPVLLRTIAVLVLCVAVLLVVVLRQQFASGTSGAASTGGAAADRMTTAAQSASSKTAAAATPSRTRPASTSDSGDDDEEGGASAPTKSRHSSSASTTSPPSGSTSSSSNSTSSSGSLPPLFGDQLLVDFSTFSSSDTVASFLGAAGLVVSDWGVDFTPIGVYFGPDNVDIVDGALRLKVTGGAKAAPVQSGEVATKEQAILYGKVTTRAKASPVAGVCHGIFFFDKDHREVDIELLTSYYTKGLGDAVKPGIQLTNHPLQEGGKEYNEVHPYPWDPAADFHDYTIEWTAESTIFSLDGEIIATFTENVPQKGMTFNWNSWSSGEPNWSAGPPTEDSYLLISQIAANWTT